jgi:hypothetical protein
MPKPELLLGACDGRLREIKTQKPIQFVGMNNTQDSHVTFREHGCRPDDLEVGLKYPRQLSAAQPLAYVSRLRRGNVAAPFIHQFVLCSQDEVAARFDSGGQLGNEQRLIRHLRNRFNRHADIKIATLKIAIEEITSKKLCVQPPALRGLDGPERESNRRGLAKVDQPLRKPSSAAADFQNPCSLVRQRAQQLKDQLAPRLRIRLDLLITGVSMLLVLIVDEGDLLFGGWLVFHIV